MEGHKEKKKISKAKLTSNIIILVLFSIALVSMSFDIYKRFYSTQAKENVAKIESVEGKCFRYTKEGHILAEINKCSDDGLLEIPSEIDGVTITEIEDSAYFEGYSYIKIPSTITSIGNNVFDGTDLKGIINESSLLTFDAGSIVGSKNVTFYSVLNPNLLLNKCYLSGKDMPCSKLGVTLSQLGAKETREIPIKITGSTAIDGKALDSINLSVTKAKVTSYSQFLDTLDYVEANPNNNTFEDGKTYSVELTINDYPYLYSIDTSNVTVTVTLDDIVSKDIEVNLQYVGLDSKYLIEDSTSTISVRVEGTKKNIEELNVDDIKAYVYLTDLVNGLYDADVVLKSNNIYITPYTDSKTVSVKIGKVN